MTAFFDLTHMPDGERYEDRYGQYLETFRQIAEVPLNEEVLVRFPPASWLPLLGYLQCRREGCQIYFKQDSHIASALLHVDWSQIDRSTYEVLCSFRPECVDALWKLDRQWPPSPRVRRWSPQSEFVVTCSGSFDRPEIKDFEARMQRYEKPPGDKVILVPCAADKPYPSHLHKAVQAMLPDDSWYLAVTTGVLGVVPQDLWDVMPNYDSGIPNQWRLMKATAQYFRRFRHRRIVVYCDFNNDAIMCGLEDAMQLHQAEFINEAKFYADYLPLHDEEHLNKLKGALGQCAL